MTEPHLDGSGVPSTSRRSFFKLGGSLLGILLLPDLALAATKSASRSTHKTSAASKVLHGSSARTAGSARNAAAHGSSSKGAHSSARAAAPSHGANVHGSTDRTAHLSQRSAQATAPAEEAQASVIERVPSIIAPRGQTPGCRSLSFYNLHTGEAARVDYFVDGSYDPDGLREIDYVLRDYHTDETCPIDPELLNQVHDLRAALGSLEPFTVFSGYRSPETNEAYRRIDARVAEHSFHVKGQAIDLALPGRDLRQLRMVALSMQTGGVGYYPWSGFIHVDTGPIRRW